MTSSVCFSEVVLKGERDVNRMEDEAKVDSQRGADGGRKNDEEPRTADERAAVQARTFTRWINLVLQRNDPPAAVRDLFKDIRDGRILMALLERLSGSQLLYRFRSPPQRIFRLKNVSKVLAFLDGKQVDLLSISASGVVDGDPSVVLSLLWSIILHFQAGFFHHASLQLCRICRTEISLLCFALIQVKQVVGGLQEPSSSPPLCSTKRPTQTGESGADTLPSKGRQAARESEHHGKTVHALLQRVQRCTSEFGVQVEDFGKSWSSGLVFLALIKSINPTLVDLRESLLREPRENIQQAFTLASRSLGIAPLLEPDDVLSTFIDEPSIITYVSTFFQHCSTTDEDCSGCSEDTEANFGSLGTGFGGNLAIDPEAQALLKCSEKSCEQQLWKKWSRRASARGNSEEPVGDGASGSKKGRYPNPPSPLNANIASQEIQSWMKTSDRSQHRMYESHFSLSSEEGVYNLSVVDSEEEEEAWSPILGLNRGVFQPCSRLKTEKTLLKRGQTGEKLTAESGVDRTSAWNERSSGEMVNNELEGDIRKTEACEDESFVRGQMSDGGACIDKEGNPRSTVSRYHKTQALGGGATEINHSEAAGCKKEQKGQTERSLFEKRGKVREQTKSGGGEEEEEEEGAATVSRGQHWQERDTSTRGCSGICQTFRQGGFPPETSNAAGLTPPETEVLLLLWILTYCCFILYHMIS